MAGEANWKIYHNPKCGTSRNVLGILREAGKDPEVIEYLRTPPGRDELVSMIERMGGGVRGLLRRRGTPYDELGLDDPKWSEDQLVDFMVEHPILMERPVVVAGDKVKLCRPKEEVQELLDQA